MKIYGPETCTEIYSKITGKGWNTYRSEMNHSVGIDATIRRGPTGIFTLSDKFLLLPTVDAPRDPQKVMEYLEKTGLPYITVNGESREFMSFRPMDKTVIILSKNTRDVVLYDAFLEGLDKMTEAKIKRN